MAREGIKANVVYTERSTYEHLFDVIVPMGAGGMYNSIVNQLLIENQWNKV